MNPDLDPREVLRRSCDNASVAPAYIFEGADEDAKNGAALYFAGLLNCGSEKRPCGGCLSCRKINALNHPDVRHIRLGESKKKVGIDEVRGLKSQVYLKPYEGSVKVFIVHDAHFMNQESSNAILKVLEEPPAGSVIILLAPSAGTLLATIVSRCRILRFRAKGTDIKKEPGTLEEELERDIASLRDALVFKVTGDEGLLLDGGRKEFLALSGTREAAELEADIKKLIDLRDGVSRNANPKIVRDVFSNTMRRYKDV